MFKDMPSGKERLSAAIKGAVVLVALALVTIAVESPRLIAGAADAKATATAAGQEARTRQMPPSASEYFPAQFPAPTGEAEPLPPTF